MSYNFSRISVEQASAILSDSNALALDVRNAMDFQQARIPGAVELNNTTVQNFIAETDPETPLVVYCYHGISSQQAAAFLAQQGFDKVYSMDGGFEAWRASQEIES